MACSTADKNKAIKEASKVIFNDLKEQYPDVTAKDLTTRSIELATSLIDSKDDIYKVNDNRYELRVNDEVVAYIDLSTSSVEDFIEEKDLFDDVDMETIDDTPITTIDMIEVEEGEFNKGYGNKLLNRVLKDRGNEDILLEAYPMDQFEDGRDTTEDKLISWYESKGFKLIEGIPEDYSFMLRKGAKNNIEFGSTANSAEAKWNQYDRIEKDVHGDIKAMKALLRELHELGGRKEDEAHVQELEALFDDMQPKFFKEVTTYLQEVAGEASGIASATNIGIKYSKKPKSYANQQSEAEVYAHEVIHSMIMFAKRAEDLTAHKFNQQVEHIFDLALKNTTWENFLPAKEDSIDAAREEKAAKEMFDYIFSSEHAAEEFMAHALTNPIVAKHLKTIKMVERNKPTTLFGKVKELFLTILEILSGDYDFKNRGDNVQEQAKILAMELGEINNSNVRKMKSKINLPMRLWQILQTGNDVSAEFLENTISKLIDKKEYTTPPDDTWGKAKWMAKAITKMLVNAEYRKALALILSGYGMDPRGDIQTILRDFVQSDDTEQALDMLAALSDKVDNAKVTLSGHVATLIKEGFTKELTADEEIALTRILIDTDMSSIYEQFNDKTLSELLRNEKEVVRRISRKTKELEREDGDRYYWNKNQAFGLGYYMATGKAHIAQNLNAENIAIGLMSEHRQKPNKKVVALIDEIATLTALQYTDPSDRAIVANLLNKKERAGINNIMAVHNQFKKESDAESFKNNKINKIKGYSRELYDDKISMAIAPIEDEERMSQEGYTLKAELPDNKYNKTGKKMAMYVADSYEVGEYYRNATRLTSTKRKGTTVTDIMVKNSDNEFERNKARAVKELIERDSRKLARQLEKNDVDLKDLDYGMAPVLDGDGFIMDFRYMMTKEHKIKDMGQNQKISEVMANSFAHKLDKVETEKQNKKVLDMILKDMEENYTHGTLIGKNMKEYIVISDNSSDKEVQELIQLMPPMFKRAMGENKYGEIAVRADLFHSYFGYRHLSILDNKYIKMLTPKVMHRMIKIVEKMWQEFIKISKIDILIKMPIVMVGNVISNMFYSIMTGTDPITLIREYITSIRDVSQYFNRHSELVDLELAKKTGNIKNRDLRRIEVLKRQLEGSSIHELAELGIYQSIKEDMDTRDTENKNRIKKIIDEKMQNMPSLVKDGVSWLYLTEGTKYYAFMDQILTKSDLTARDIENKKMKRIQKKQADGEMPLPRWYVMKDREYITDAKYTKTTRMLVGKEREAFMKEADKMRHSAILNAFVNYNKPSGRVEEYLNKMGAIMFTKYAKRIQKVIAEGSLKHPLNALAIIAGEEFIFGDMETIFDQQLLTKSWYSLGITDSDFIPGTNPFTRVMEVLNPPLVQLLI